MNEVKFWSLTTIRLSENTEGGGNGAQRTLALMSRSAVQWSCTYKGSRNKKTEL